LKSKEHDAGQMVNNSVLGQRHPLPGPLVVGQCFAACSILAALTYFGFVLRADLATIGFIYLLLVVSTALFCGFWYASLVSLLAVACLDYFFTQPLFRFAMANPHDWVALATFQTTALVIGRLSGKELRSSREAAAHRKEMEQLYELSRSFLLLDLHEPPGPQLVVLIHRIFSTRAVALFDVSMARQDRMGDWNSHEEDVAKECYLQAAPHDDPKSETVQRILKAGFGPVGALVVRGKLSTLVVDALASLAAMAMDRHQSFEKEERAETASKSEQLRAAVMDALAHEFKTPLTGIVAASSGLLELGGLAGPQRDLAALIDDEAVRLNELCTRLLLTAKLDAKQVGLEKNEVSLDELVAEALTSRPAQDVGNRIEVQVEDPATTVDVDRALVAMILTQYIDNARKYSRAGSPIVVAARTSHTEVVISVHNFGSTIQIEDRERIFDRFYRAKDLKDSVPGTGIGLSVVRKAAEAHHGHVWVISDDKEGTTFFLSLPIGPRRTH
jgi:two-component system, OmpR family, sensor histidine kinase KdpD